MNEITEFTPPYPLNTAVLFLVFNRLSTTKKVFQEIRKAKPPRLYIAADGPRSTKTGEFEKVAEIREYILQNIDWSCEIKTLFREQNLGCKYAVSSAISWFFKNEEHGIILEDDCLPSQSFFWYCEELLEKYNDDQSVYLISGDSRGPEHINMKEDYGLCKYPMIWGWASWSRVWVKYDPEIKDWPNVRNTFIPSISKYKPTMKFWSKTFEKVYKNEIDTWDYQFCYLLLKNRARCIVPKLNLISNLGFGIDATHTFNANSKTANRILCEIELPLNHKLNQESESRINEYYDKNEFYFNFFLPKALNKMIKILKNI